MDGDQFHPSWVGEAGVRLKWKRAAPQALPNLTATIQSEEQLAEVAQLVEQLIRNQQVIGSSPIFGSIPP